VSGTYDWSKPLGQRRPKIMERMPNLPPPKTFEIDEDKLRSALPPPVSSGWEDFKVLAMILGTLLLVLAWLGFTIWALFTAPPLALMSPVVLVLALLLLLALRR